MIEVMTTIPTTSKIEVETGIAASSLNVELTETKDPKKISKDKVPN